MRTIFQRFIGIDWSGAGPASANSPGLAIAEYSNAGAAAIRWHVNRRSRDEMVEWLRRTLRPDTPPCIIGMDFSFGFPVGAMEMLFGASTWSEMAGTLRLLVSRHGTARGVADAINARPDFGGAGPFRTDETRNDFRFHLDSGIPYYRTVENYVPQAISGWYLGSGRTVGHSVITGLAALGQLLEYRRSGEVDFRVWPFEDWAPGIHLMAEVYPAIWPKPVPDMANEHERDAIRIATALSGLSPDHLELPEVAKRGWALEEGWILGVR